MTICQPKLSERVKEVGCLFDLVKSQCDAKPENDDYGMKGITTFKVAGGAYAPLVIC
jgi:hypothetical protein